MNGDTPRRWRELRAEPGPIDPRRLDALWADLEVVEASEILGSQPLICRAADGGLYPDTAARKGEASLWNVEFRGGVTATVVYDGREHHPSTRVLDWSPDDQCLPHRAGALRR